MKVDKVRTFLNTDMQSLKDCEDFIVYGFINFDENGFPVLCTNLLVDEREMAENLMEELKAKCVIIPLRLYYKPISEENEQA